MNALAPDVLIIGGGLAGLACAVALLESGLRVVVLERSRDFGGRARSCLDSHTGDRVDLGPHVLLTEYPNFRSLLKRLGTEDRVVWQHRPLITLASTARTTSIHARPLPAPLHLVPSMLKARDVPFVDKLSNARAVSLGMRFLERDVARFDELPATELLRALRVSPGFTNWFWKSVSLALMNVPLEACSAGALMRFFSYFLGRPDGRFGFPACALDELFAPAARRLIEASGGKLIENCEVTSLAHDGETCTGARVNGLGHVGAQFCVAAVPPKELEALLPGPWRTAPAFHGLERFQPSQYISLYLWFDEKLSTEHFWARTWNAQRLNYDFYDLSNIRSGWSSRGSVFASNIVYSQRVASLDDEQIVEQTLRELGEFIPGATRASLRHYRVHRIPMAIPCPRPGTERARPRTESGFPGLLLAGDWTRTGLPCSMESAVRSGFLAAEHILERTGRPQTLAKMPRPASGIVGLVQRLQGDRPPLTMPG